MPSSVMMKTAFAATWTTPSSFISNGNLPLRTAGVQKTASLSNGACRRAIMRQPKRARTAQFGTRMQAEGGEGSFPLPPAGVLLLLSSVGAIASIGCVFELSSGHPQYGVPVTATILAVSLPAFIASYVAAIKKGQLESKED